MIIVKVINQKIVQVAFTSSNRNPHLKKKFGSLLEQCNNQNIFNLGDCQRQSSIRCLTQSSQSNQKVTNANQQQLIPIARNISFRQCHQNQLKASRANTKASYSVIASNPVTQFISLDESVWGETSDERVSPIENLKRRARDVVERKERSGYYGQSFNEAQAVATGVSDRKLVVLMSWLEAQEKHIEKYRQFYLERGFDVLNVKTSPLDLLLPSVGAKKISKDFIRFMLDKQYSDVVYHGFSVGGYMFGQVLVDIDQYEVEQRNRLLGSIRGLIFDSLVPLEGTCIGVANSVTRNPLAAKLIENCLKMYLILGEKFATKYYNAASDKVWGGPLKCPSLFFLSKDDRISDHRIIERLISTWDKLGIETDKMIVESAPHVQLFLQHHEAYVNKAEQFLKRIKLL